MSKLNLSDLSAPLAREQIDRLPDGTEIVVTWSGGNGQHRYILKRRGGIECAVMPDGTLVSAIGPVGESQPDTVVHLAASSPDIVLALVARVRELEDALRLVVDGEPEGMAIAERVLARCLGD